MPYADPIPARAKILLLSPNQVTEPYPVFPIGLAQIGEMARSAGYEVRYWDALQDSLDHLSETIRVWEPDLIGLSIRNVDNVSINNPVNYIRPLKDIMRSLRQSTKVPIVLGGSGYSLFPIDILDLLEADYGIAGDGGPTFLRLLESLFNGAPIERANGIYFQGDGIQQVAGEGEDVVDFPVKPPEAWIRHYIDAGGILNVQTQRGCALKCTYCTYPTLEGHRYRFRPVPVIIEEIRHLHQAGVRYIFFVDSVLNTNREHIYRLASAIRKAGLQDLQWGCFLRPVNLDGDLLDTMIQSGLSHIEFGSDSFSDQVLPRYGKSFRFREIEAASRLAASRKLHFCHFLIFGGPGETFATIEDTIAKAESLPESPIFAFVGMRVYPGTPLYAALCGRPDVPENLLEPFFFLEKGLEKNTLMAFLTSRLEKRPNWIFGDQPDGFLAMAEQMRKKGRQGPLWEYYPVMRRLKQ